MTIRAVSEQFYAVNGLELNIANLALLCVFAVKFSFFLTAKFSQIHSIGIAPARSSATRMQKFSFMTKTSPLASKRPLM